MPYLTPAELMERFDASELAQVAPPESMARVSAEVMRAVILDQDTSGFEGDEVAAAAAGVIRIQEAIDDAGQETDGWLGQRYPLPIDPAPGLLKRWVGNIARFNLHDDDATDEIRKRYEDTIKSLKAVAEGRMSLGLDDPAPGRAAGPVATKRRRDRVFTEDTLQDYGNEVR